MTPDVDDHTKLGHVVKLLGWVAESSYTGPVVLASQVPPGFTRKWINKFVDGYWYYQVDTIIMNCALRRATFPERIVVGAEEPSRTLPRAYQEWLTAFECPIFVMGYESAEMVKLAVNYYLAKQVETTNELAWVAGLVGAHWDAMIPAIAADKRMGAYLQPGTIEGSHLVRDVKTINSYAS